MGLVRLVLVIALAGCGGAARGPTTPVSPPAGPPAVEPVVADVELNRRIDEIANGSSTRCVLMRAQDGLRDTLYDVTGSAAVTRIALFGMPLHPAVREPLVKRTHWLEAARHFIDLGDVITARTALERADELAVDATTPLGAELVRRAAHVRLALGEQPDRLNLQLGIDDVPALVRGGFREAAAKVFASTRNAATEDRFKAAVALDDRVAMTALLSAASSQPSPLYVAWLQTAIRMRRGVDEAVRELIAHRRTHLARWGYDDAIARALELGRAFGFAGELAALRVELRQRPELAPSVVNALVREALHVGDAAELERLRPRIPADSIVMRLETILTRSLDEGLAAVRAAPDSQRAYLLLALWGRHVQTGFGRSFERRLGEWACGTEPSRPWTDE